LTGNHEVEGCNDPAIVGRFASRNLCAIEHKEKGPEQDRRSGPGAAGVRQGRRSTNTHQYPASAFESDLCVAAHIVVLSAPMIAGIDLIADHAADRRAADGADRAAAGEDGTPDRAYAGADRGVLVALRHPAAPAGAEQHRRCERTECVPLHRFHCKTSSDID
jgi:hypothetical protein